MKKISIVATMAIAVAMMTSCGNSTPKADMKSDIDSLSYAFGIEQSQGIKQYLQQMEIDTAYIDDFVKGLNVGTEGADDKKQAAYNAGVMVGQQLTIMQKGYSHQLFPNDSTKMLSMKNLIAGFVAGTTGKDQKMTVEQARTVGQKVARDVQTKEAEKKFAKEKKASDDFMAANAKKEGVKTLGQGVQYKVIKEGTGAIPTAGSTVNINYEGKTIEGKVFDKRDGAKMPIGGAIPGFTEALTHMPVGSKWEIYIPYSAGYGAQQAGPDLKPFSALIFTVELLGIETAEKTEQQAAKPETNKAN
ncbi:MAG: FKBP-type peptidyl-prolyl cis-trans isomerase [Prevotella sp.]|nr:FKBP-type peptidyl-prolyl cis-trans isomerase [Prevotella sp.]